MYRLDEIVPAGPLEAEVVLHVRRLLRDRVRRRESDAAACLALLFGFSPEDGDRAVWLRAAADSDPLQKGAAVAAKAHRIGDEVVPLGHDPAHVARCRAYLMTRKTQDDVFTATIATDLATLLELSKARELATAEGLDDDNERRPLPILIRGATGTGKELLARAIHTLWSRKISNEKAPYEVIHVAGMTEGMINAEIFGHVKGAFTDAKTARPGKLEDAHGGTVLIDEVGDLPEAAQLGLLRFLQTQRVARIGQNKEKKLHVRVLAATWHNLDDDVAKGTFRQDLLYRLRAGADLYLQPLNNRPGVFDDVVPEVLSRRQHRAVPLMARSARDALALHDWPGNLRELVGVLEQALAVADGQTLRVEHLPASLQQKYLALPLFQRAVGFLSDELDGQNLDAHHAAWRARQIASSLESAPVPAEHPELQVVTRFLNLLDDSSQEHKAAIAATTSFSALEQEQRRRAGFVEVWDAILRSGLPTPAHVQVEVERAAAVDICNRLKHEVAAAQEKIQLDSHPWFSLLKELTRSPLLAQADHNNVVAGFVAVFNVLKAVAPDAIDWVREAAAQGGLAGIRSRVVLLLREKTDGKDEIPARLKTILGRPPASLKRDEWEEIARLPTQAEALDLTGFDPKTIAKYFAKHELQSPWRRNG